MAAHKQGNAKADKIADIGAALYGKDVHSLAAEFHKRHNRYYAIMKKVITHIVEGYLINAELNGRRDCAEQAKKGRTHDKLFYQQLGYPELESTTTAETLGTLLHYSNLGKSKEHLQQIEQFISWRQPSVQGEKQRNITWLELYTLFRIRGYGKPIADHSRKGLRKATLDKQLRAFKANFRGVVARILEGSEHAKLFKPAKQVNNCLIFEASILHSPATFTLPMTKKWQLQRPLQLSTVLLAISNSMIS